MNKAAVQAFGKLYSGFFSEIGTIKSKWEVFVNNL